jgi:hypothetical protein
LAQQLLIISAQGVNLALPPMMFNHLSRAANRPFGIGLLGRFAFIPYVKITFRLGWYKVWPFWKT